MPFDINKFNNSPLRPRTATIEVPDLKDFFGEDEKPAWVVRGLTGSEIARAQERSGQENIVKNVVEAIAASKDKDKMEALKKMIGIGDDVPDEVIRRQYHLAAASVSPEIDQQAAVRIFEFFPIVGYQLTNKILELTGEGAELGKREGSTVKKK